MGKNFYDRWNEKPDKVNGQLASRVDFFKQILARIVKSCYSVKCPDDWNKDYILNNIVWKGYLIITDTPSYGVLPLWGSLTGFNYFNFPTRYICTAPLINSVYGELDTDGVLIYNEWMYPNRFWNFSQMIAIFAQRLASCDAGIDVNVFNSRAAYFAEAETEAQSKTIKAAYDEISEGNPLVVAKTDTLSGDGLKLFFNNLKNNYIANDMQDTKASIMHEFLTLLGINNANTDKKERLITSEVESNNEELFFNIGVIKANLEDQSKKCKKLFGDKFSIEYIGGSIIEQEGQENDTGLERDTMGVSKQK